MPDPTNRQKTKNKYRAAAKFGIVSGPGVWCTCPMGKERQAIGELRDVFDSVAEELWPREDAKSRGPQGSDDEDEEEMDLEKQLASELAAIKTPTGASKRFRNIFIDTKCLAFISCTSPEVDPVKLVHAYFEEIERTRRTRTRHVLRLSPMSGTCNAHVPEMIHLMDKLLPPVFKQDPPKPLKYKIQVKTRNNNKIKSLELTQELARCVPKDQGHVVDLNSPEVVILVEIYQVSRRMDFIACYTSYYPVSCVYPHRPCVELA